MAYPGSKYFWDFLAGNKIFHGFLHFAVFLEAVNVRTTERRHRLISGLFFHVIRKQLAFQMLPFVLLRLDLLSFSLKREVCQ